MPVSTARRPTIALAVLLGLCAPTAFAHGSFGGHGGGSGGHSSSFGGHGGSFGGHGGSFGGHGGSFGAHGGNFAAHSGSGMGGHAFAGSWGGAHIAPQHFATQHFTPRAFSSPRGTSYVPGMHAPAGHFAAPGAGHTTVASGYGRGNYGGHNGYPHNGYAQNGYGHGGWHGGGYYSHGHGHWGGGYWGGRWWPGVFYGAGFAWFLASLPVYCPVFWWDSVPYYYYNEAYYIWSPTADGYVATDPPPVAVAPGNDAPADVSGSGTAGYDASPGYDSNGYAAAPAPDAPVASGYPQGPPPASGSASVYAYPSNGQTADQQATDRRECEQWGSAQAGASGTADYRRAVIACFQGRGYSAQ